MQSEMNDLISREALLGEMEKFENPMPNKSGYDFLCGIATAITEIENAPTVDALKWTSVKEGLPNLIPCDAGTAYSEAVNVLTTGRKVLTAIWDGFEWICDAEFWDAEDEEITHWAPVPLPLPDPPGKE